MKLNLTRVTRTIFERPGNYLRVLFSILKKENFFLILGATSLFLLLSSLLFYLLERRAGKIAGFGDALWWAAVTITTVGYGDVVPATGLGRVLALGVILAGLMFISLLTATIASVFIEEKIREAEGLETLKERGHVVLCGWNSHAENVLRSVLQMSPDSVVVLVNELPREEMDTIRYRLRGQELRYVRGDFVREDVLERANLAQAAAAIVLADTSRGTQLENADQRTIFAVMAIKSVAPGVRTCAELLHSENREHLIRANVDEVVVRGELGTSLLAAGAVASGLPDVLAGLLSADQSVKLWKLAIPQQFLGRPCRELREHLWRERHATLVAILTETLGIQLADILSHDSTAVDRFIKRKFEGSGKDYFSGRTRVKAALNPPDSYIIGGQDSAVVMADPKAVFEAKR